MHFQNAHLPPFLTEIGIYLRFFTCNCKCVVYHRCGPAEMLRRFLCPGNAIGSEPGQRILWSHPTFNDQYSQTLSERCGYCRWSQTSPLSYIFPSTMDQNHLAGFWSAAIPGIFEDVHRFWDPNDLESHSVCLELKSVIIIWTKGIHF